MWTTSCRRAGLLSILFTLLVLAQEVPALSLRLAPTATNPLTPSQLNKIIQSPHIGYSYVTDESKSLEVFVIGTSHFRCNSAQEVSSLINEVQPDGVVLELDPERVLRLTKQYAGFDEMGQQQQGQQEQQSGDLLYGADFLAAVNAAQRLDIPLFLGDEYAQETKQRLAQQVFNWKAYSPIPLLQSILAGIAGDNEDKRKVRVDLLQTFVQDPKKLTPLVVTSSPALALAFITLAFFDNGAMAYDDGISTIANAVETAASIMLSGLASCLLFNTVIAERDEILAASTMKASGIVRSLKDNTSIRKQWKFTVKKDKVVQDGSHINNMSNSLPLFTLKTPLVKNAIRNLNLFEPRWLKMIDDVTKNSGDNSLQEKQFGCVRCTNKFYSATSVNGAEGRYADVIFEKVGTLAKITELKEGKRPVSGDRKIGVRIEGGDSFVVDESNLSVVEDGYMVASNVQSVGDTEQTMPHNEESISETVRLVVVVGLLHGNGVVDLISKTQS